MNKEYITNFIRKINEVLDVYVSVSVEEAELYRYALYAHCNGNKMYCWSEVFEQLDEQTKKLHIIHAYAILLDADISRRGYINVDATNTVHLLINPNKLARVICKLMDVEFVGFEKLQKTIVYNIKSRLFPYPNPKGTFFKAGDEIRSGMSKFEISNVFYDNDNVMVTACSVNSHYIGKIITLPELEMMEYYRIITPTEFQDSKILK